MLLSGKHRRELKGGDPDTTNNRMELLAAIRALEALKRPCEVEIHTDSQYLRRGVTEWLRIWKRNQWKTASRKPVRNRDLWELLDDLQGRHRIRWYWVKGHSGDPGNERADRLANEAIDALGQDRLSVN